MSKETAKKELKKNIELTEVVKQDAQKSLAVVESPSWLGHGLSTDTRVPRLLLMQGTSEFVEEEKAKRGDVVRSTTAARVGGMGQPIPMIILSYPKQEWIVEHKPGKKWEYIRCIPRTRQNESLKWGFWG